MQLFETKMTLRSIDYRISIEVPSTEYLAILRAAVYGHKRRAIRLIRHLCNASLLDAKTAVQGNLV